MEHMALPSDLLASLLTWTDPRTVARFACTYSAAVAATDSENLWFELYESKWRQAGSMLTESLSEMEEPEETPENLRCPMRWLYKQRVFGEVPLTVVDGIHTFEGTIQRNSSSKGTPVQAVLGLQRGRVGGYAMKSFRHGADTTTLQPECAWVGMYGAAAPGERSKSGRVISWDESSSSGPKTTWRYCGEFAPDGMSVTGTFHMTEGPSSTKQHRGTFTLHAKESATAPTFKELSRTILQLLQTVEEKK
mmetsp:Transcript_13134/g.24199  ORF Transcript_13134/g.24199 Transcript_13134/m.24199 type:complete len:249 (+) Transcript_13134:91-837(+)